jgi:hypothetical protein
MLGFISNSGLTFLSEEFPGSRMSTPEDVRCPKVTKFRVDTLQDKPHPTQLEAEWTMEEREAIEAAEGQDLFDLLPPPVFPQTNDYKIHSQSWKRVPEVPGFHREKQVTSNQEAKLPTKPANRDSQAAPAETSPQKEETSPLATTIVLPKKTKTKGRKSSSKDAGKKDSGQKAGSVIEDSEDTALRRRSKKAKQALVSFFMSCHKT